MTDEYRLLFIQFTNENWSEIVNHLLQQHPDLQQLQIEQLERLTYLAKLKSSGLDFAHGAFLNFSIIFTLFTIPFITLLHIHAKHPELYEPLAKVTAEKGYFSKEAILISLLIGVFGVPVSLRNILALVIAVSTFMWWCSKAEYKLRTVEREANEAYKNLERISIFARRRIDVNPELAHQPILSIVRFRPNGL